MQYTTWKDNVNSIHEKLEHTIMLSTEEGSINCNLTKLPIQ